MACAAGRSGGGGQFSAKILFGVGSSSSGGSWVGHTPLPPHALWFGEGQGGRAGVATTHNAVCLPACALGQSVSQFCDSQYCRSCACGGRVCQAAED